MRLHPFETSDNILEAFRSEVDKQLKQHKIAVRWHPCSPVPPGTLSLVIHHVAERLNVARLLHEVQQLAKEDGVCHLNAFMFQSALLYVRPLVASLIWSNIFEDSTHEFA
jgi:hypothetical protein